MTILKFQNLSVLVNYNFTVAVIFNHTMTNNSNVEEL